MKFKVYKELSGKREAVFEISQEEWDNETEGLEKEEIDAMLGDLAYLKGMELLANDEGENIVFKIKKV